MDAFLADFIAFQRLYRIGENEINRTGSVGVRQCALISKDELQVSIFYTVFINTEFFETEKVDKNRNGLLLTLF